MWYKSIIGTIVWSSNVTTTILSPPSPVVAELLPNGNFVLRDKNNPDTVLWQSFDHPTNTLLPEMKLGWDKRSGLDRTLTSWKSKDDPSKGDFSYKMDYNNGFPQRYMWEGNLVYYRSDPLDRVGSSGTPTSPQSNNETLFNFTVNKDEVTYSFRVVASENKVFSKLRLSHDRLLQSLTWHPTPREWITVWEAPINVCDTYHRCTPDSICDVDVDKSVLTPVCRCYGGFEKKTWPEEDKESQCRRKTKLNCHSDGFLLLKKMKLPDTKTAIFHKFIGMKECRNKCLLNCNCTAFASIDTPSIELGCLIWLGKLIDLTIFTKEDQDLYVRLAAVDLEEAKGTSGNPKGLIAGITLLIALVIICLLIYCLWIKRQKRAISRGRNADLLAMQRVNVNLDSPDTKESVMELPNMDFDTLVLATNHFSDSTKLGEGGFGIVHKGRLLDGKEIAVKRLTQMTVEGKTQFRNEVELIGKLQHKNLVRLLGYCHNSQEHILIYEYLENLSLASYLFGDTTQRCKLNCQKRLEITKGIARGLQYLHADSRFRIIHRDMKASNILLDKEMIPKISDFGLARLIGNDETGDKTKNVVGTWGYMSPEYLIDGIFSTKSDVFSFGVLLLELLSGKRNSRFQNSYGDSSLLTCVWRNREERSLMEIVDSCIADWSSHTQQVLRFFQIGLLCVQEHGEDRPTMQSVVVMLESESAIPQPKPPGYSNHLTGRRRHFETGSSSSSGQTTDNTWNDVTMSLVEPR